MDLVLVRHGQSTWNLERRLQGQVLDVPLTELGRRQAAEAAAQVATLVPRGTPVVSSDQLRAQQTAMVVAEALGGRHTCTELLREQSLGSLEGRLVDELRPEPVPDGVDIAEVAWGGGESLQQVHERCRRLLGWLAASHGDSDAVVLVGHGDALRVLLAVLDRRGHRDVEWTAIANGQVLRRSWAPRG